MSNQRHRIFYVDNNGQAQYFVKRNRATSSDEFSPAYLQAKVFPNNQLAAAYARQLADAYRGRYFEVEYA